VEALQNVSEDEKIFERLEEQNIENQNQIEQNEIEGKRHFQMLMMISTFLNIRNL
jgi:hypothetical protein